MGDLHMSMGAVRHGLHILVKYGMLKQAPGGYYVRKYCPPTQPAARPSGRRLTAIEQQRERQRADAAAAAAEREEKDAIRERENEENRKKVAEGRDDPRTKEIAERLARGHFGGKKE